jgi:hypothetical protein
MAIYHTKDLYNKYVQEQLSEAFLKEAINEVTYKKLLETHPTALYTPNLFIRIALTLLTLVAVIFSGLLFGLIFQTADSAGVSGLLLIFSLVNYAALELLVKEKKYYNAGVDNLLMLSSMSLMIGAFAMNSYPGQLFVVTGSGVLLCLLLSLRFTDAFMAVAGYLCLFLFIFLVLIQMGATAKAAAPFLMTSISAAVYLGVRRLAKQEKMLFYRKCCKWIMLFSLITLYASSNYFVVKQLSIEMLGVQPGLQDEIPFGWLFWAFTFLVPIAYLFYGTRKKNLMVARTGLIFIAVSVFTFRYYYAVIPAENAMAFAGVLLILVSYTSMKLLRKPRYGFNFDKNRTPGREIIDLKALVLTQVAGKKPIAETEVTFGGGNFGGGGAGGEY